MRKYEGESMILENSYQPLDNESGIVTIFALFVLVILTITGIAAIHNSNNETQIVSSEQISSAGFYDAESGVNDARINYVEWLTDDFLNAEITEASDEFDAFSTNTMGNPVATIKVRCIEQTGQSVFDGEVADEIPLMPHTNTPPSGSGYSAKYFQIRRYSITSTATSDDSVVQVGVWKIFNKS